MDGLRKYDDRATNWKCVAEISFLEMPVLISLFSLRCVHSPPPCNHLSESHSLLHDFGSGYTAALCNLRFLEHFAALVTRYHGFPRSLLN
jgi:hypothetical protein